MWFQKFHLNRIKYLILILLSLVFLPSVKAIVKPTSNFYINDYANILSSETEEYILNKSVALNNVDGTQIVVVTVPNLEGMTLESYATKLFREFGIGDKDKNNGLLLLLALEEREFRVEVGYGLEGILPDGKTGRFQDEYIIPYLRDNNWDQGIRNGYDAFYKEIVTLNNLNIEYTTPELQSDISTSYLEDNKSNLDSYDKFIIILSIFTFFTFFVGIYIRCLPKNNNKKKIINYIMVWSILFIITIIYQIELCSFLIFDLFFFFAIIYGEGGGGSSRCSSSRGSSFRSSSSSRGFSVGGGSSGGGGSSRGF